MEFAIFHNEKACFQYLEDNNVFYRSFSCPKCGGEMARNLERRTFRCVAHKCRAELNLRVGTFFWGSNLPLSKTMHMAWNWIHKTPTSSFPQMFKCSSKTAAAYVRHFRNLIASDLNIEDSIIGGDGVTVEIDECKFGRRKYHRGHRVDGVWVLGGVETGNTQRSFFVQVANRSAETLLGAISLHVREGSVIRTDLWKGYTNLSKYGYTHDTVNHSKCFKDPITNVHTNSIEGTWNGLKLQIKPRNRTRNFIDAQLLEAKWRKKNNTNLWGEFIRCLADIHYEIQ